MNLQHALANNHSKQTVNQIVEYIDSNPEKFNQLMEVFYGEDTRLSQRAAWSMSEIAIKSPDLLLSHLGKMIDLLPKKEPDAIKRNILRTFQFIDLPEKYAGLAFENALNLLIDPTNAIAIRAFAITIVTKICNQYPELKNEVLGALDMIMEEDITAAIKVRCRNSLSTLNQLS
ncbi:MAG: hypothetical protein ACI9J3_000710 [Parvicellaceae bacterium]